MWNQPTIEKLPPRKLHGMADGVRTQLEDAGSSQLSFEERFALLVDQQWLWKENRALARRLQSARLKQRGAIEDIDYHHPRGLDRKLIRALASSAWIRQHQNLLLIGPTGMGKSWLACALAHRACRDGYTVHYIRVPRLFAELELQHGDGRFPQLFRTLTKANLLILDDWGPERLSATQRRHLMAIIQ